MKRLFATTTVILAVTTLAAGCQSKKSTVGATQSSTVKPASVKKAKIETPPNTYLTSVLKPYTQRLAEDKSTQSLNRMTYSQFYYRNHAWHWSLTTKAHQKIRQAKIVAASSKTEEGIVKLTAVAPNSDKYTLTLDLINAPDFYTVKSTYGDHGGIKGTFVNDDTTGQWTAGVPSDLRGSWKSDYHAGTGPKGKKDVHEQDCLSLSEKGLYRHLLMFDKNYSLQDQGSFDYANDEPYYQELGHGKYLLKTYNDGYLMGAMTAQVSGKSLTWKDHGQVETYTQNSTTPDRPMGRDDSPALNLTDDQAKAWIKRHLGVDAPDASYQRIVKHGEVAYNVVNGAQDEANSAPHLMGCWRISRQGVLEQKAALGVPDSQYEPVSDDINH